MLERIFASNGTSLTFERFEAISSALADSDTGSEFSLPNKTTVTIGYKELIFSSQNVEDVEYCIPLKMGSNPIPSTPYTIWLETEEDFINRVSLNQQKINKITKNKLIGCNIIKNGIYVRNKKDGDKFRCRDMTKSVKKYLIDKKIDKCLRSSYPVVCDNDGIVWVDGIGVADRALFNQNNDECGLLLSLETDPII